VDCRIYVGQAADDIAAPNSTTSKRPISSRVKLIADYITGEVTPSPSDNRQFGALVDPAVFYEHRSVSINSYDLGHPGSTINDFWVVFVPRALWPDKPDTSRPGAN